MTTVVCKLPADKLDWRPELMPGSDEAFEKGCTCPSFQPCDHGYPGELFFDTECPIHELEKRK